VIERASEPKSKSNTQYYRDRQQVYQQAVIRRDPVTEIKFFDIVGNKQREASKAQSLILARGKRAVF
jgi:hypothetical protein